MHHAARGCEAGEGGVENMKKSKTCQWILDDEGIYHTGCDRLYELRIDKIEDEDFKWCPYCRAKIEEKMEEDV